MPTPNLMLLLLDVVANSDKSISPCDICVTFVSKFCGVNVLGLWLMSWLLFSC